MTWTVALLILSTIQFTSGVNLQKLFKPENEELLKIMKEELNSFQVEMTKSFMEAHSRQKRALPGGTVTDMSVAQQNVVQIVGESVGPFSTFTFDGLPYIIRRDGIYEIKGLLTASMSAEQSPNQDPLTLVGEWNLSGDEQVLHGYEWKHNFFLLTTNGTFSTIYTMHENKLNPIFRQRIFNKGNAVTAQFFEFRRNLYLVMGIDNAIHSTTFSSISRWAGSYMDEIHQVQTTGATAIETFTINSKKYIAIAQSRDSTGNMELGTMVLSMDHTERLERVQLLWSHGARDLHYMSTDKEHFLIIGQDGESSSAYWFGGMDFIFWQQFDGLQGKSLFLNGFQLNSDEPILIGSDGGPLRFFTRSASTAKKLTTTWVESKTFDSRKTTKVTTAEKIVKAKFLQVGEGDEKKVFLAVTNKVSADSTEESTQIYPVDIVEREISISRTQDPDDSLLECMQKLDRSLQEAKPFLSRIQEEGPKVLRTDKDFNFRGVLESERVVKKDPSKSNVGRAHISPGMQRAGGSDGLESSPSTLLSKIRDTNDKLELMHLNLTNVVYKSSQPNMITGSLTFPGSVEIANLEGGATNLKVEAINDVNWNELQTSTLKRTSTEAQRVTGEWQLESMKTEDVLVENENSKLSPNNFILTSCSQSQDIVGQQGFAQSVKFTRGLKLDPAVAINNVAFSDVVMKESKNQEIKGYKHAAVVKGDFTPQNLNDRNLLEWFASVGKINSPDEQRFTGPVKFTEDAAVEVEQLTVTELNSQNWDKFKSNVMLDGENQHVKGFVTFDVLRTDQLQAGSISGIRSQNLLTSTATQHISSLLEVENLHVMGPLTTGSVNGVHLSDAVNRNAENVGISGRIVLQNCHAQDILVPEGVLIADKDVSELAKLRKVHVYSTADGSPIMLKGVKADKLHAKVINGKRLSELDTKYWSKTRNNVVNASQLVLSSRAVSILNDNFQTKTVNEFKFPEEFVSLDQEKITLKTPLRFEKPVNFNKEVTMTEGATIENVDMSEVQSMIVDDTFQGIVRGKKTLTQPAVATNGAEFTSLNGMDLRRDVVMLNSDEVQKISGIVGFEGPVEIKTLTVKNGDVEVEGLVNELDMKEVKETTVYKDQANFIGGDVVFENAVQADKFSAVQLNDINVGEITANLMFLNHPEEQVMEGGLQLDNADVSFFGESVATEINSIPVNSYLSSVARLDSSNGVIQGTKTLIDVLVKDKLMCNSVNDVNLVDLEQNALSKTKSQVVSGKWSLRDVKMKENLEASNIAGVSVDNMVFTDESFEVTSPVTFISSDGAVKGSLLVDGMVNQMRFDESLKDFLSLTEVKNFDHVSVTGNLDWNDDQTEQQRLSYFFNNAVQKSGPQSVLGKVHFLKGLKSSALLSPEEWLAGVNMQSIKDDALMKDSANWELSGNNKFSQPLRIKNLVQPVSTVDAENVNGVNLEEVNNNVYKVTDEPGRIFKDTKMFDGELLIDNFIIQKQFSDFNVNEFVTKNDAREINEVHFKDISINDNIEWPATSSSGLDLPSLLTNRVSLTKPHQELEGSFTFQSVMVERNCKVPVINDIKVSSTVHRNVLEFPPITGKKIFAESLKIDGDVDAFSLNNHPMEELLQETLRLDQKEVITRPVIFEKSVVVKQPVEIESVNDLNLKTLPSDVSARAGRIVSEAQNPELLAMELNSREEFLQKMAQERPVWLEYLRLKQDLTVMGAKSRVDHIKRNEVGDILITFHHNSEDVEGTGLPQGCRSNKVTTLQIQEMGNLGGSLAPEAVEVKDCMQMYHVASDAGTTYTITSETFSINATCISDADKTTKIFAGQELLGEMKLGHVSDVGVFSDRVSDYLVLAQYFDTETRSHSTTTRILRVGANGVLETVQEIETHGAKKIALSQVSNRWMLAVANSKNPMDETSCNADSAIYAWSAMDEEFLQMRTVMTDGVFDVQFITTESENEFYRQSFVAFAQEGNSASGEVMIFKYEQLGGNFVLAQTIRSEWPITAVGTTCLCRQCFLMTAVPQEGVTFYENRFVEGFQEYYKAPVFGATDITSFTMNKAHLFAIATLKGPILAEAVMAGGSC